MAKHVAILGAESSGKTLLTQQLSEHYKADAVYEYARDYMTTSEVTREELELIARQQYETENQIIATSTAEYIFFDTEMLNLKVWFEYEYKKAPQWLEDISLKERYDLYLITANDLPWQPDTLRSMPEHSDREKLREQYITQLHEAQVPYAPVQGEGDSRVAHAIDIIDVYFAH